MDSLAGFHSAANPRPATAETADEDYAARETSVDLGELYGAVAKRWRLLFPVMAVAFGLAGAYIVFTPSRYMASMSILVDPRERAPVGSEQLPLPAGSDSAVVESQMRLIASTAVLTRVVEKRNLAADPEFAPKAPSAIMTAIKSLFGTPSSNGDSGVGAIVEELAKRVTVKRAEKSNVIDVDVKASSRERARELAQAIADAYLEQQGRMDDEVVARQSAWLDKRLEELRLRVEEAEHNIGEYRRSNSLVVTDGRLTPEQQLKDANTELVKAQGKRAEAEARWEQVRAALRGQNSMESLGESLRSPVIEKLRGQYSDLSRDDAYAYANLGPLHPTYQTIKAQMAAVKAQIHAELKRISASAERDLNVARSAEKAAAKLVAQLEASINNLGDRRTELNELERRAASLRATYEKTLAARENVRKDIVASPNAVLINQPVADRARVSPRPIAALIIAGASGVNLWILAALILEYLDRRRRRASPEDAIAGEGAKSAEAGELREPFVVPLPPSGLDETMFSRPKAIKWRELELFARRAMTGPNAAFAATLERVSDALAQCFEDRTTPPVIAIASSADAATTTLVALCLALGGRERGYDMLLLEREGADPGLKRFVDDLPAANGVESSTLPLFEYKARGRQRGEILFAPFSDELVLDVLESDAERQWRSDVILVDLGELETCDHLDELLERVDGVILAERDGYDLDRLDDLLANLGLEDRWLGVVSAPRVEARVQAS